MTLPLFTTFCVFAVVTLALALRRQLIVRTKGDECLHLLEADAPMVHKQETAARRLDSLDAWGKGFTILTVVSGVGAYIVWWMGW